MISSLLHSMATLRRKKLYQYAGWWTLLAAAGVLIAVPALDALIGFPRPLLIFLLILTVTGAVVTFLKKGALLARKTDSLEAARLAERARPEWGQAIRTAADLSSGSSRAGSHLAGAVINDTAGKLQSLDWSWIARPAGFRQIRGLAVSVLVIFGGLLAVWPDFRTGVSRFFGSGRGFTQLVVSAQPSRLLAGQPLRVAATLTGRPVSTATLHSRSAGKPWEAKPMTRVSSNEFDFVFGPQEADLECYVTGGDGTSKVLMVSCSRSAAVDTIKADLIPPAYTGLPVTSKDGGDIEAVEGTQARLKLVFTKPVKRARLVPDKGQPVPLQVDGLQASGSFILPVVEGAWHVDGEDEEGMRIESPSWRLSGKADRLPSIKLLEPLDETSATAIWELPARLRAADDFGLARVGISLRVAGEEQPLFNKSFEAPDIREAAELATLFLAKMPLKITDNVQVFAWATDHRPRAPNSRAVTPIASLDIRQFQIRYLETPPCECAGECVNLVEKMISMQRQAVSDSFQLKEAATWRTVTAGETEPVIQREQEVANVGMELGEKMTEATASGFDLTKERRYLASAMTDIQQACGQLAVPELPSACASEDRALTSLMNLRRDVMKKLGKGGKQAKPKNKKEDDGPPGIAELAIRLMKVAGEERDVSAQATKIPTGKSSPEPLTRQQQAAATETGEIIAILERHDGITPLVRQRMVQTEGNVSLAERALSASPSSAVSALHTAEASLTELAAHLSLLDGGSKDHALVQLEQKARSVGKMLAACAACGGKCSGPGSIALGQAAVMAAESATLDDVLGTMTQDPANPAAKLRENQKTADLAAGIKALSERIASKAQAASADEPDAGIAKAASEFHSRQEALADALGKAAAAARQSRLDSLLAVQKLTQDAKKKLEMALTAQFQNQQGQSPAVTPSPPIVAGDLGPLAVALGEVKDETLSRIAKALPPVASGEAYGLLDEAGQRLGTLVSQLSRVTLVSRRTGTTPPAYRRVADDYFRALSDDFGEEVWEPTNATER